MDGKSEGLQSHRMVVIRDGRIAEIKPCEGETSCMIEWNGGTWDIGDVTVLPGFIDAHVHLTLDAQQSPDEALKGGTETILLRGLGNAQSALKAGVTTVCDCGARNSLIFALREAVRNGSIVGPRVVASGDVITTSGGHGCLTGVEANNVDEIRSAIRKQIEAGADFIKVMVTGGGDDPISQYASHEIAAAVTEARGLGKKVVAHCHGPAGIKDAVEAGVDRIEHCTFLTHEGVAFDPEIADRIAQENIYVCPTNSVDYRKIQDLQDIGEQKKCSALRDQLVATWRGLLEHGVKFVAGSDAGMQKVFPHDYALIMELMVWELGLSPMQAILSGTKVAAQALGMESEIGTLEIGKRADIVIVAGNPLEAIDSLRDIRLVMVGGGMIGL
jgi:imidazolonepropionase-like amidohydrolase